MCLNTPADRAGAQAGGPAAGDRGGPGDDRESGPGAGQAAAGQAAINRRVGRDVGRKQVAKHFLVEIGEDWIRWARPAERIAVEVHLDGVYIIRTSLAADPLGA